MLMAEVVWNTMKALIKNKIIKKFSQTKAPQAQQIDRSMEMQKHLCKKNLIILITIGNSSMEQLFSIMQNMENLRL